MEFKIQRSEFLKSLQRCQGIVPGKGAMSILSYILLKTMPGGVELTATDLEISIRSFSQAEIIEEGQVTLLSRKAFEIIRELPDAEIHFIQEINNTVKLVCGKSSFAISALPATDFPSLPKYNESEFKKLDSAIIADGIKKTVFAVPTGEVRYSMNGVLLEIENNALNMAATDGHRLACVTRAAADNSLNNTKIILPKKFLMELRKIVEVQESSLEAIFQEKQAVFKSGDVILTGRLIEGSFPNYKQVIPEINDNSLKITVAKDALIAALRRVSLLSDERNHGIKMQLQWGQMLLNSQDSEWGDAHESIEADYKGEELTLGFNANYLLEILGVIDEEKVIMAFNDVLGPCLIIPEGSSEYKCVIMPLRMD